MLGLKYGTVRLVDHDTSWSQAFANEHALLHEAFKGLDICIEHVGSTAVPGLPAKPILDMAVGITTLADIPACIARLQQLGYEYRGDAGPHGGHLFVRAIGDIRTHHLHVVLLDGPAWRGYLGLRDLLRTDPVAREQYATGKAELARRFADDRKAYTQAKEPLVGGLLRRGLAST